MPRRSRLLRLESELATAKCKSRAAHRAGFFMLRLRVVLAGFELSYWTRERHHEQLIPSPIDQNRCAHWRNPMDMMRQG